MPNPRSRHYFSPRSRTRPSVLALGCVAHREFADAIDLIRETADLHVADSADELVGRLHNRGDRYDLALCCTSRPGVLPDNLGERLIRHAPFAGRAVLLGSWCEGGERTGRPWIDTERVFWYRFAPWWNANLHAFEQGHRPTWLGGPVIPTAKQPVSHGVIVVQSADWESTATMMATLGAAGYTTIAARPGHRFPLALPIAAGVWIGSQLTRQSHDELTRFTDQITHHGGQGVLAVLDFPRADEVQKTNAMGATVLGKPWRASDVVAEVSRLVTAEQPMRIAA